jgi:uncharacterized cupin superfamily protein
MANVFEPEFEEHARPGFNYRRARVGRDSGAERLGASLYEIPPGQATFPYHWHSANEEMLIVLAGRPSLRTPAGWRQLEPGEAVSFHVGLEGAHQIQNRGEEDARVLLISEMIAPEVSVYPDSGKIAAATRPPGSPASPDEIFASFPLDAEVDYWQGEPDPE